MEKTVSSITVRVFEDKLSGSQYIADALRSRIHTNDSDSKRTVLGLATGGSPKKVYDLLVESVETGELSFQNVTSFNLDEYYPIGPESRNSYHYYMNQRLFNHTDVDPGQVFIPEGDIEVSEVDHYCKAYERKIAGYGGIEIQLLGIGGNGHIGFNEPGSSIESETRLIHLDEKTRRDAADSFGGIHQTPEKAITMGVKTILNAKKIYCMAWGAHKARPVQQLIEGEITAEWPVTFLQTHANVELIIDRAAASLLTDSSNFIVN